VADCGGGRDGRGPRGSTRARRLQRFGKGAGALAQEFRVAGREAAGTLAEGLAGRGLQVRVNPRAGELGGVNISGATRLQNGAAARARPRRLGGKRTEFLPKR